MTTKSLSFRDYIPQMKIWAERHGFSITEPCGNIHTHDRIPEDAKELWLELMEAIGYPEHVYYKEATGSNTWLDIKLVPFHDPNGKPIPEGESVLFSSWAGREYIKQAIDFYNENAHSIQLRNIVHAARKFLSGDLSPDERRSYLELHDAPGQRCSESEVSEPLNPHEAFRF